MANEGVFLNPNTGDVIATGTLSANAIDVQNIDQYRVGQSSLVTQTLTDETTKVPTSKTVKDFIVRKVDQIWNWISGAELSVSQLSAAVDNKVTIRDWR